MTPLRLIAVLAIATPALAGCGQAGDPNTTPTPVVDSATPTATVSHAALVFDPTARLEPQMVDAIQAGDVGIVQQVLAAGLDPAEDLGQGRNALHWAAVSGHPGLVPVLVDAGVPLEARATGLTPLLLAVELGTGDVVTALLEAGANVNATIANLRATPLHVAARFDNVDAMTALLDWGVDVDIREDTEGTPLLYAGYYGRYAAAEFLLAHGADVNARDRDGLTALGWTDPRLYPEIVQLLTDAGGTH